MPRHNVLSEGTDYLYTHTCTDACDHGSELRDQITIDTLLDYDTGALAEDFNLDNFGGFGMDRKVLIVTVTFDFTEPIVVPVVLGDAVLVLCCAIFVWRHFGHHINPPIAMHHHLDEDEEDVEGLAGASPSASPSKTVTGSLGHQPAPGEDVSNSRLSPHRSPPRNPSSLLAIVS